MALPATPSATLPSAATLTSSELYTQTLAAQKDVLRAAAAWPVLVNSLTELTNPPDRQQLAIRPRDFAVTAVSGAEFNPTLVLGLQA